VLDSTCGTEGGVEPDSGSLMILILQTLSILITVTLKVLPLFSFDLFSVIEIRIKNVKMNRNRKCLYEQERYLYIIKSMA